MDGCDARRTLVIVRHTPYGTSLARASIDVALAAAAFDQPVDVLFIGDGVLQLLPDQASHLLGVKNLGRQLASLPLYGINRVFVEEAAVTRFNMNLAEAPVDTSVLDAREMHQLMLEYDHLLGF
jgi:tRNA 2-thiouridine synthesizing protein C